MGKRLCRCLLVIALVAAMAPMLSGGAAAQGAPAMPKPVIGVIDLQRILGQAEAAREIIAQRDRYLNAYQSEAAEEEKALREADQELVRKRAVVAPEAFATEREEFQKRVAAFQREVQTRRRNLERAFGEAMNKVQAAVIRITDRVAAERGLNLILYRTQVFLFDPTMDITDAVLERVNKELPSVTMADPDSLPPVEQGGTQAGGAN